MEIKDIEGKYELKIDEKRRVVYQKTIGLWNEGDLGRLHNDLEKKVIPLFGGKNWVAVSDIREYKTSPIAEAMGKHVAYCNQNGMVGGAILVENIITKMQMNRAAKEAGVVPSAVTSFEEAEEWLKEQGF